jgi:hypothetical protein
MAEQPPVRVADMTPKQLQSDIQWAVMMGILGAGALIAIVLVLGWVGLQLLGH